MKTITKFNELYPSRYLKPGDIGDDDQVLTIDKVLVEEMGFVDRNETKPVLYFRNLDKVLVLNRTNANTIANLYGDQLSNWTGKQVSLFVAEVSFQGKVMPGIRIRSRIPTSSPEIPASSEVAPNPWD